MFSTIKEAVEKQIDYMKHRQLFRVLIDRDLLWDTYLKSFPKGTNPIFKERSEHDCNCCKHFIRQVGGMVAIIDGKLVSIWDVTLKEGNFFQGIADALSAVVKTKLIDNIYLHTEPVVGINKNFSKKPDGTIVPHYHFYWKLPAALVMHKDSIGTHLANVRSLKDVMLRSLTELTLESVDTVLDLIAQNSVYRGEEHKFVLTEFRKLKVEFAKLKTPAEQDIFCWSRVTTASPAVAAIRNTSIGTLLTDLSEGKDLEYAVKSFETKVAPSNYKRPTALVTKAMIDNAKKTVVELGLEPALERRYATIQDITVNNVLFADNDAKGAMNGDVFSTLSSSVAENTKSFDKVEEVNIDTFLQNILPKATSIEVMLENRHTSNLVSLIAPVHKEAKGMFKWPNNFSWSYTGEMADSMKERVKSAGGKVDGDLRCSLAWFNYDDLDLHMIEPGGYEIFFGTKGRNSPQFGMLDVDMNAGRGTTRSPVENICYSDRNKMKDGIYTLKVHNFRRQETVDVGFDVEIEYDGVVHQISYPKALSNGEQVTVAEIRYTRKDGFEIIKSLPSAQISKSAWNLPTQSFHRVKAMMLSPNYWDEKQVGNKHYMFMLDGCTNDGKARGFFNEFLSEELTPHRKVLEMVGSKMKTDESRNQLSGIGFSSTQRNSVLCRVKGSFSRVVKVVF
jgi:hypothetical protein